MPILKQKPVLDPKPPCTGCDFCGDLREDGLYLLGYSGKYYCHDCFAKKAENWPKRDKSKINETKEQRANEAEMLAALERTFVKRGLGYTVSQTNRLTNTDGIIWENGLQIGAVEAKGRPGYTLAQLNGYGGWFIEGQKLRKLAEAPGKIKLFVLYNLKDDPNAYVMSYDYVKKHGVAAGMDRTRSDRGQDDRDSGINVVIPPDVKTFQWREQ